MTQAILIRNIPDAFEGLMDPRTCESRHKKRHYTGKQKQNCRLNDRELNDQGIGRSDIESIARGTFKDAIVTNPNDNLKGWV